MGSLDEYIERNPDFQSRVDAARARDYEWAKTVDPFMKASFGKASSTLEIRMSEAEPKEYLRRALQVLNKVEPDDDAFFLDPEVGQLLRDIGAKSWQLKKAFDRAGG